MENTGQLVIRTTVCKQVPTSQWPTFRLEVCFDHLTGLAVLVKPQNLQTRTTAELIRERSGYPGPMTSPSDKALKR